jgi:hypothetical protein
MPKKKAMYERIKETGVVSIHFDDANVSQYQVAFPLMKEYGFKGIIAVPTYFVGRKMDGYEIMTWSEIRRLEREGWEIASHTWKHRKKKEMGGPLNKLPDNELDYEFNRAKCDLMEEIWPKRTNQCLINCVLPGGNGPNASWKVIRTALKYHPIVRLATTYSSFPNSYINKLDSQLICGILICTSTDKNNFSESKIRRALERVKTYRGWINFFVHGISDDPRNNVDCTPECFESLLRFIKNSKLPVITMQEAIPYLRKKQTFLPLSYGKWQLILTFAGSRLSQYFRVSL